MALGTTKSRGRKSVNDQFFTKPEVAKACIDFVGLEGYDLIIEPSAGNGSFSSQMPGCLALDLVPGDTSIVQQDWFAYNCLRDPERRVLVIGNPPFGQQNSLAVAFINHAAKFADTIAFILPISFKKRSVRRRLDAHLHRVHELALPASSFTLEGADYSVPVVFQVWEWRTTVREQVIRRLSSPYFHFVAQSQQPDLRIQRVGGNAGKASLRLDVAAASNYFIKIDAPISLAEFIEYVNGLHFPGRDFGVGPRTISKDELIEVFEANLPQHYRLPGK